MSQSIQQLSELIVQLDPSYDKSSIIDLEVGVHCLDEIVAESSKATISHIDRIIDIA
jgi:hypothetical protein